MRAPNSSASDNSAASCDRSATINTANMVTATTAILIVRITISASVITTATGYNCSPSNDRSPTIGGTTSNCTTSNCTASNCTASGHASALGPDLHNLNVINRNISEEVFWKDRNRRAHCRQTNKAALANPARVNLNPKLLSVMVFSFPQPDVS